MSEQHDPSVRVLPGPAAIAEAAAQMFVDLARRAIDARGRFSVALAGGTTPRAMYELLGRDPLRSLVDWQRVHMFWSDERLVPPDDPESNFRLAREALLDQIDIPAANIYPVPTVGGGVDAAAEAYDATIRAWFQSDAPRFDLILLGMGPDGHTASLFPGSPELAAPSGRLAIAVHDSPKPPPERVSFALPLINAAANVLVLASGAEKAPALRAILRPAAGGPQLPAAAIRPAEGALTWLIDQSV